MNPRVVATEAFEDSIHVPLEVRVDPQVGGHALRQPIGDLLTVLGQMLDTDLPPVTEVRDCTGEIIMTEIRLVTVKILDLLLVKVIQNGVDALGRVFERAKVNFETIHVGHPLQLSVTWTATLSPRSQFRRAEFCQVDAD
jgi:hypothetical protein